MALAVPFVFFNDTANAFVYPVLDYRGPGLIHSCGPIFLGGLLLM